MRRGGACLRVDEPAPRPSGGYLAAADLERQLGNAFRKGLYRLAVMSQRTEDAMDLGQRLPTGLLRDVSCDSAGPRPGGGGAVGVDVQGLVAQRRGPRAAHDVRRAPAARSVLRGGRDAAPRRRYDSTIRTYSADPLDALGSVRRGC